MIAGFIFAVGLAMVVGGMSNWVGLLWIGWATMAASLVPFNVATSLYLRSQGGRMTPGLAFAANTAALLAGLSLLSGLLAILLRAWKPAVFAGVFLVFLIPVGLSTLTGIRSMSSLSDEE